MLTRLTACGPIRPSARAPKGLWPARFIGFRNDRSAPTRSSGRTEARPKVLLFDKTEDQTFFVKPEAVIGVTISNGPVECPSFRCDLVPRWPRLFFETTRPPSSGNPTRRPLQ